MFGNNSDKENGSETDMSGLLHAGILFLLIVLILQLLAMKIQLLHLCLR